MASAADAEAERKRVRGRAYVKRFYEKKKATLATLQAELAALDAQYSALAAQAPNAAAPSALQRRYESLTQLKWQLYAENDALRARATEHMIREARLQQILDMERPRATPRQGTFHFRWITSEACQREIAASRAHVAPFLDGSQRRRARGLEVFGWSDQRDVADGQLAFAFEKTFHNTTPRELIDRTWVVFTNEATHSAIFSASMNARVHMLQRVDDNAMLFYWRLQPDGAPFTIKCVFLLLRFAVPDGGFVIVCRHVGKEAIALDDSLVEDALTDGRPVYWAKIDTCTVVQRCRDRECDVTYLFRGASMSLVWTVEVLLICMRFETLALGARRLPPTT